jgi:ABC-2 type transport system ATP-binding protein
MNNSIVRIDHLSHRYSTTWAVRDINLDVERTGILGLLGANGAGKSTTMNILCGSLQQTEGKVYIDGIDMAKDPIAAKQLIGFLPQIAPLHLDMTVDEYLKYCAGLRGMTMKEIPAAVANAKERCGIANYSKRLIRNLSGGYRQRVGIAQAIIHKPRLVVLDEPTNGLDPNQIIEVRGLIKEIAQDHAVILSTHILSEVQVMCRDIRMIDSGRIVFADTMEAFNNYMAPHSLLVRLEQQPCMERLLAVPGVTKVAYLTERNIRIWFDAERHSEGEVTQQLVESSIAENWQLREIGPDKNTLDEIFAQLSNQSKMN